jgi:hypothetical protein
VQKRRDELAGVNGMGQGRTSICACVGKTLLKLKQHERREEKKVEKSVRGCVWNFLSRQRQHLVRKMGRVAGWSVSEKKSIIYKPEEREEAHTLILHGASDRRRRWGESVFNALRVFRRRGVGEKTGRRLSFDRCTHVFIYRKVTYVPKL